MSTIAFYCPEVSGHLEPTLALGRALARRGHRVALVGRLDAWRASERGGVGFIAFGEGDFPLGSVPGEVERLGRLTGRAALRYTVERLRAATLAFLRDAPDRLRAAQIDLLVADEVCPAGAQVAERLGVRAATLSVGLAVRPDPALPPVFTSWRYGDGRLAVWRNQLGNHLLRRLGQPILTELRAYRRREGLVPVELGEKPVPGSVHVAQQPAFFDFPRRDQLEGFHYTGPFRDALPADTPPFPYERLTGAPLIYVSLGSLQNRRLRIFSTIAEACSGLGVQLVVALGHAPREALRFPAGTIAVEWAPQAELLSRAAAFVTHAGLNSALDALAHGVPMVAVPITNDQPGVAARLAWLGAARVVSPRKLTASALRRELRRVLTDPSHRAAAQRCRERLQSIDGCAVAANILEQAAAGRGGA